VKHQSLPRVQYVVFPLVAPQMEVESSELEQSRMLQNCHGSSYPSIRVWRVQKVPRVSGKMGINQMGRCDANSISSSSWSAQCLGSYTDIIQLSPQMHVRVAPGKTKDRNSSVLIVSAHAYKKFPALKESWRLITVSQLLAGDLICNKCSSLPLPSSFIYLTLVLIITVNTTRPIVYNKYVAWL